VVDRSCRLVGHVLPRSARDQCSCTDQLSDKWLQIGGGFNALAALHFIQTLQLPGPPIPYVTSMTFYAPQRVQVVMIGVSYEKGVSRAMRDMLTSSAFGLQQIVDLDSALHSEIGRSDVQAGDLPTEQLDWFVDNRQAIVESMRLSAQGAALGKKYDCDFTSRLRPPAGNPAALVIAGGTQAGVHLPSAVIAQRLVFVE
jgi:hypothetical protein